MDKIRYGVVGLNGVGGLHARLAHESPELDLRVLVDTDQPIAERESAKYGTSVLFDYHDLLDADVVDAVSVCVPHHLLSPITTDFLEAGIHVFVEKPFAIHLRDADRVVNTAARNDRRVCVGFQHRTYRLSQWMKEVLDSGQIGSVKRVLWTWHEFRPNIFYDRNPWRTSWGSSGGGLLMHQVSHQLDLMCWLFGQPTKVTAILANQIHSGTLDDFCSATIEFDSGCTATLQMSLNEPNVMSVRHVTGDRGVILVPNVRSTVEDRPEEARVGVFDSSLSRSVVDNRDSHAQPHVSWTAHRTPITNPRLLRVLRPRRFWTGLGLVHTNPPFRQGHGRLMASFAKSIRAGTPPIVTENDARHTVELINSMIVSSVLNKTIHLPLDRGLASTVLEDLDRGEASL